MFEPQDGAPVGCGVQKRLIFVAEFYGLRMSMDVNGVDNSYV